MFLSTTCLLKTHTTQKKEHFVPLNNTPYFPTIWHMPLYLKKCFQEEELLAMLSLLGPSSRPRNKKASCTGKINPLGTGPGAVNQAESQESEVLDYSRPSSATHPTTSNTPL